MASTSTQRSAAKEYVLDLYRMRTHGCHVVEKKQKLVDKLQYLL